MLSRIFGHADVLEKGLDVTALRMEVASQNVANVDTPGYDRKRVEFESAFSKALNGRAFPTKTTRAKHFEFSQTDPMKVKPNVVSDVHYVKRMDDNNVDIDVEMIEMAKNTIQYNTLVQKANKEFARLKLAIREGR